MARRRPRTFTAWALGVIGTILAAVLMYYVRVYAIERIAQGQMERSQAAIQRIQEQQAERMAAKQAAGQAAAQQKAAQDTYDAQVAQVMAESKRRHDDSWNNYYVPPKGCDVWRGDTHMVECVNHKIRSRKEFERKWAAGEFDHPGDSPSL